MNELSQEEAILKLEQVYSQKYDPNSNLSVFDQLLACEVLASENLQQNSNVHIKRNGSVKWNESVNGTYKRNGNDLLTESKIKVISELNLCNYRTPPIEIAQLLEKLFIDYPSTPGHLLFIAQHYSPRTINWVIAGMIKRHRSQWETIQNPPAYFTHVIKRYYKPRKKFRKIKP